MNMKKLGLLFFTLALFSLPSFAWNCSNPLAERVVVPSSTSGTYGDGNGQLATYQGQLYECEVVPTATNAPPGAVNTNTNNATSASNSTSSATGGNASSTATGGNASSNQTQGQKQGQSQSSNNNNQSAGGSVSNVGNSVTNVAAPDIPVNSAYAPPVFSSVNCFKGFSAGAQTPLIGGSFGGGGIDKNCAAERAAQDYLASGNRLAFCKVMVTTKQSKDAGVTLADCMNVPAPRPMVVAPPVVAPAPSITVNFPVYQFPQDTAVAKAPPVVIKKPITKKHVGKPCIVPPSLKSEGSSS